MREGQAPCMWRQLVCPHVQNDTALNVCAEGHCIVSGRPVLELGSGTGIVGLAAAALGAAAVCLTDRPHVMSHLKSNIKVGSATVTAQMDFIVSVTVQFFFNVISTCILCQL